MRSMHLRWLAALAAAAFLAGCDGAKAPGAGSPANPAPGEKPVISITTPGTETLPAPVATERPVIDGSNVTLVPRHMTAEIDVARSELGRAIAKIATTAGDLDLTAARKADDDMETAMDAIEGGGPSADMTPLANAIVAYQAAIGVMKTQKPDIDYTTVDAALAKLKAVTATLAPPPQ